MIWQAKKRVSHSPYGAEILACGEAEGRGFYIKHAVRRITKMDGIKHIIHVDPRERFDTISTLHDGKEYRFRQKVQRICDRFESGDIDVLRWLPTGEKFALKDLQGDAQKFREN